MENEKITDLFGSLVFNDAVMRERLSPETYRALKMTVEEGTELSQKTADEVAAAMKDWAVENGATHFTHWFQPMTGITAEKHDSFLAVGKDRSIYLDFSGKELIKGEPDASSFPSGGLRATFEARGYTAWDPSSYAFIKDRSLCIPTVFCSYGGEALDKKTPLLKSVQAVNEQSVRLLRLLGNREVKRVIPMVGIEQEYFLIDRSYYEQRRDLKYCGHVLFGAKPPKGQEMEDHYFGSIKPRIGEYMHELDVELWKLGVYAKTKHNEAAPAQHELAPIFSDVNTAVDHNQLTMETMKRVARKHNLVCLLHEKPFDGINGSGKHDNWSLVTDTGVNLFDPGTSPDENMQFLLFFSAVIKAVDEYQDILRLSVATAGNDHRLGANEAPPSIISVFIGRELEAVVDSFVNDHPREHEAASYLQIGINSLPRLPKDSTDRNRTSPFAFTGNKFEFRMPGSSMSMSGPNTVINTIVSDVLRSYCDELEKAPDIKAAVRDIIKKSFTEHSRIIFNGDGYTEEWKKEARKRGLADLTTAVDAFPCLVSEKAIRLFTKAAVYSEVELRARYDINVDIYCKTLNIEVQTMTEMASRDIYPAISAYISRLAENIGRRAEIKGGEADTEMSEMKILSALERDFYDTLSLLRQLSEKAATSFNDNYKRALFYCDEVIPVMKKLRKAADECELHIPPDMWPYPSVGDMIFKRV